MPNFANFITLALLATTVAAATDITQENLSGTWVGVRNSAAYTRYDNATRQYTGGCINDDVLDVFFAANINTTDDAVVSNVVLTVDDDQLEFGYTVPSTNGNGDFRGSQVIGGVDAYRTGFNGTATLGNGLANISIPAQNGLNATTACLRWDVDTRGNAVTMKTTQEIRMLFVNGTMAPIPTPCPTTMAPIPVCTDSRASAPTARAPVARAPAPVARAPVGSAPAPAPRPPAPAATSYLANCTRASQGSLSTEDLATCLGYLAYGLQTPAAELRPDPTSRIALCYAALSDGEDFTTNQARTCISELRNLYSSTIGSSTSAASAFCSDAGASNCAACSWCQASFNVRCTIDCTQVNDFPDVTIDGETYTIYSSDDAGNVVSDTPDADSTPDSSIITADQDTVNAVNAVLGAIGGGSLGSFGGRKLLHGRDLLAIRSLGGASTSSSDFSQLPAGAYVITSVVTSTLRCTEGACLDLLQ